MCFKKGDVPISLPSWGQERRVSRPVAVTLVSTVKRHKNRSGQGCMHSESQNVKRTDAYQIRKGEICGGGPSGVPLARSNGKCELNAFKKEMLTLVDCTPKLF